MKPFLAGLLLAVVLAPALAGRTCEAQAPQAASVQRAVELAERTRKALDASGADVVALARIGQDLSKYALIWSHFWMPSRGWGRESRRPTSLSTTIRTTSASATALRPSPSTPSSPGCSAAGWADPFRW
jgi:hypothetical protein